MDNLHLISKYAICYGIFFLLTYISKLDDGNRLFDSKGPVRNPGILLGFQIAGILWLGVIPFFIFHGSLKDVLFGKQAPGVIQLCSLLLLVLLSVTIAITEAARVKTSSGTKESHAFVFSKKFIRRYILYRILFLINYEIFFRGYLLTDITLRTGILISVTINTGLYTLLHIFNSRKEIISCVPFGIVLCTICMWFGAAWPAVIIHTLFTIVYELRVVKKNSLTINKNENEDIHYRLFRLHRE